MKVIEKPDPQPIAQPSKDFELEEAIQSSKPDSSETQKLRVEISMLKAKKGELTSNLEDYKALL